MNTSTIEPFASIIPEVNYLTTEIQYLKDKKTNEYVFVVDIGGIIKTFKLQKYAYRYLQNQGFRQNKDNVYDPVYYKTHYSLEQVQTLKKYEKFIPTY